MPGTVQPLRNWAASTDADTVGRSPPSSLMPGDVDVSVHVLGTLTRMRRVVSVSCTVPGGIVLPASVIGTVVEVEVVATLAVGKGSVGPGSVLAGDGAAGALAGAAPTAAAVPATHTASAHATAMTRLGDRVTAPNPGTPIGRPHRQ